MQQLTVEQVKAEGMLIYETIAGSRAYGLHTAQSDTDIRGVFVLPKAMFYGLGYIPQVSNASNDIVYYELGRFVELLIKNNPTIMEMLYMPADCVQYRDSVMDMLRPELFLSKLCEQTFANYAFTQVKKAYGLKKKIVNPVEEQRKSVLDFCYVYDTREVVSLQRSLATRQWQQEHIGLAAIPHLRDCYHLYYDEAAGYTGIMRKEAANDVCTSSITKGAEPAAMLYFNKDGYSVYCKTYKAYWNWVENRNADRYNNTLDHGKRYDSKNMMHVFRLLLMAKEIATEKTVNVLRKDRDFLLSVKAGKLEYEVLVEQAETMRHQLPVLYAQSGLLAAPDQQYAQELLIKMREVYYG
jgi:uncharacterized protein